MLKHSRLINIISLSSLLFTILLNPTLGGASIPYEYAVDNITISVGDTIASDQDQDGIDDTIDITIWTSASENTTLTTINLVSYLYLNINGSWDRIRTVNSESKIANSTQYPWLTDSKGSGDYYNAETSGEYKFEIDITIGNDTRHIESDPHYLEFFDASLIETDGDPNQYIPQRTHVSTSETETTDPLLELYYRWRFIVLVILTGMLVIGFIILNRKNIF